MSIHFSSNSPEWATPDALFQELDKEFHFTLDPCSTHDNAKCKRHFTIEDDGLSKMWFGRAFMNPPYGRAIASWMKKAFDSSLKGVLVVCLVPARSDTKWWHDYAMKGHIRFIRGRIKFGGHKNSAPFPSAIVIFDGRSKDSDIIPRAPIPAHYHP